MEQSNKGFTLMEVVISIGVFAILIAIIFQVYNLIVKEISIYRDRTTVSFLAGQYLEIIRNLPYSDIGTENGNPHGDLPDFPSAVLINFNGTDYKIYYVISYIDDAADGTILANTDTSPNDYKQVKLYIENTKTETKNSFLTNVSSKGLEGLSGGGALYISVINAIGQPVSGAQIHITNNQVNPNIDLTRTSDLNGDWVEVALPASPNSYHISVTKNEYSVDQTYPVSDQNLYPIKEDATILDGQVTQINFAIDKLSSLVFDTIDQSCNQLSNIGIALKGSKLIGTPNIYKFNNNYTTNSQGHLFLPDIEWDSYTPTLTNANYMIYGSSPIQEAVLLPNTTQNFTLMLGPATQNSLLVIVKDSSTSNAIEGANVNLQSNSQSVNIDKITGGSVLSQQDWSLGPGQDNFIDNKKYFSDNGNIKNNVATSGIELNKNAGSYLSPGQLVSSSFDTGTENTSYTTLNWQPTSQPQNTILKFQLAANNDNQTWNYAGPDGTAQTYYQTPGSTINSINNNKRYIRYKAFLETTDENNTPVLTSVNINYVSGCFTPGQVMFASLLEGNDYNATISATGFETQTIENITIEGYNVLQVLLSR